MRAFESIGQWHDMWSWLLLSAPDRFRPVRNEVVDQTAALKSGFERLRSGFHFAERKVKDERVIRVLREMIDMSQEAYVAGNVKLGAHILQECEGMIWKKQSLKIKHAIEAERRAFGAIELYKNVCVSIYPYEGTSADLGEDQKHLLAIAQAHAHQHLQERRSFHFFAWARETNGRVVRISVDPFADNHAAPPPLQKSWRASLNRIRELAGNRQIRASVIVELVCPSWAAGGSLSFNLEQCGYPKAHPRCLVSFPGNGFEATNLRYHLDDPYIFPEEAAQQSVQADGPASGGSAA